MHAEMRVAEELERRLTEVESHEAADPLHAKLSGRSLTLFLVVAGVIAVVSWIAGVM
ncbi:hypothetical protein [Leucobacter sp. USHLN153]|uniref:hypothetical protein n=1 Tax=Leucobacter sp. USHLN153 TaxID=3081268 RepID=UPI003019C99B